MRLLLVLVLLLAVTGCAGSRNTYFDVPWRLDYMGKEPPLDLQPVDPDGRAPTVSDVDRPWSGGMWRPGYGEANQAF